MLVSSYRAMNVGRFGRKRFAGGGPQCAMVAIQRVISFRIALSGWSQFRSASSAFTDHVTGLGRDQGPIAQSSSSERYRSKSASVQKGPRPPSSAVRSNSSISCRKVGSCRTCAAHNLNLTTWIIESTLSTTRSAESTRRREPAVSIIAIAVLFVAIRPLRVDCYKAPQSFLERERVETHPTRVGSVVGGPRLLNRHGWAPVVVPGVRPDGLRSVRGRASLAHGTWSVMQQV